MAETMSVTRQVPAPRDEVWAAFTDLQAMPSMISGITRVEPLDGHDTIVEGARWRETRTMFGREATEEMEAVEVVDGERYVVEAESAGTRYRSTFSFHDAGQGMTNVTMSFSGEPQTLAAKIMGKITGPIGRRAVQRAIEQDLEDVAASFS